MSTLDKCVGRLQHAMLCPQSGWPSDRACVCERGEAERELAELRAAPATVRRMREALEKLIEDIHTVRKAAKWQDGEPQYQWAERQRTALRMIGDLADASRAALSATARRDKTEGDSND